jgi:hypothetical protein
MQMRSSHDVTGTYAETKCRERGVREEVEGMRKAGDEKKKKKRYRAIVQDPSPPAEIVKA